MKVSKLGVEFEGEFISDPNDIDGDEISRWSVTSDGSLRRKANGYCCELVSEAFLYADKAKVLSQLKVLENTEKKVAIPNTSCGTHIHISFEDNVEYCKATQFAIYEKFIKAYKKAFELPKYSDRLADNSMCQQFMDNKDYIAFVGNQLSATSKNSYRYRVFNFCKNLHGTLEIRIFPYVTTLEGLDKIIDFVYNFFNKLKVAPYSPLANIMKYDKISIGKNTLAGAMLESFTCNFTRAGTKMYFDIKSLPFDLIKFIYHTTTIGLHKDD